MTEAYYSAVIDHPVDAVWSLIRDFNNYPAYIDGVSESLLEDNKGGDEVGRSGGFVISATGCIKAWRNIRTSGAR